MAFLKSWFSHAFCIVVAIKGLPITIIHNVWESHDFKNAVSCDICLSNLFEILKDYCRPSYLLVLKCSGC